MNLLIDFIPFQYVGGIGGHASFTKRIIDEILIKKDESVRLFAVVDSKMPNSQNYDIHDIANTHKIIVIDIANKKLSNIISEYRIDTFFISIGQLYAKYDLSDIQCKIVMFIHDIFDVERCDNWIDASIYDEDKDTLLTYCKRLINLFCGRWKNQMHQCYKSIMPLYCSSNTIPYTVSEYTKHALQYYFPDISNEIHVCYSPLKESKRNLLIENEKLNHLIESHKQYLLMIAANRRYKNPHIVLKVFKRIKKEYPDLCLLTLKYGKTICSGHIDINFLSDSDLENAYMHAKAVLFPSFFEGFGYPPVEAMKYGTPAIVSNVTSIPEIIKDAGFYFSPFYPASLYKTIKLVLEKPNLLKENMDKQYHKIITRQETDLNELIKCILS